MATSVVKRHFDHHNADLNGAGCQRADRSRHFRCQGDITPPQEAPAGAEQDEDEGEASWQV